MSYELKDGQGSLFKNNKTKDTQPDYTGEVKINNKVYRLSAWIKEGKNGKFMSLSCQESQESKKDLNDSVPFRFVMGVGVTLPLFFGRLQ